VLQADASRLRQVVYGLVTNARLHGQPREPVLIQLAAQNGTLLLDVSNVGPEIPRALAQSMFNPFRKADDAVPARKEGLGLSLYIAQQVVRAHGGEISYAYAEPYVMFTVTLPQDKPAL
jgi:signal transduction histidine kinase